MSRLVVYHIPETRSERVIWLLEELGAPYEVQRLSYRGGDLRSSDFLAVNPFGMVPAISHGDVHLRETGAIFAYLLGLQANPLQVAPGQPGYVDYLHWLHSAEATLFQPLAGFIMHTQVLPEEDRLSRFAEQSLAAWHRFAGILDSHLQLSPFAANGRFSAADVLIGHVLRMARLGELELAPASDRYLERISARPAFQAMLQR